VKTRVNGLVEDAAKGCGRWLCFALTQWKATRRTVLASKGFAACARKIDVRGIDASCDRFSMWFGVFEALATVGYNPLDSSQGLS
jgi:hypothetical protein